MKVSFALLESGVEYTQGNDGGSLCYHQWDHHLICHLSNGNSEVGGGEYMYDTIFEPNGLHLIFILFSGVKKLNIQVRRLLYSCEVNSP